MVKPTSVESKKATIGKALPPVIPTKNLATSLFRLERLTTSRTLVQKGNRIRTLVASCVVVSTVCTQVTGAPRSSRFVTTNTRPMAPTATPKLRLSKHTVRQVTLSVLTTNARTWSLLSCLDGGVLPGSRPRKLVLLTSSPGLTSIMLDGPGTTTWATNGTIITNVIATKTPKLSNRALFIGTSLVTRLIGPFGAVVNRGTELEKLLF